MNSYKYNFKDEIPDIFLNHPVKVKGEKIKVVNYGLEKLNIHPYLARVFKKYNNIGVIQGLLSIFERKNSFVRVVSVFEINGNILIFTNKLVADIQSERRISFRFYFNNKKI